MKGSRVIRVAFAEDHVSVRQGIVSCLHEMGGITVAIQANNGEEMINQLMTTTRVPDICIIDISMPKMDGFLLLTEIKRRWPRMGALILTKHTVDPFINKMIKIGANGYLTKESSVEEIKDALLSIHQTGYYYSEIAGIEKFNSVHSNDTKPVQLNDNQTELLMLLAAGMTNKQIAIKINKTAKSIKSRLERLCIKLKVNGRAELIVYAIKSGIVPTDF
ncbi:response regulator [Mucilaginibacter sp.]